MNQGWSQVPVRGGGQGGQWSSGSASSLAFRPVYEYLGYLRLFRPAEYPDEAGVRKFYLTNAFTEPHVAQEFELLLWKMLEQMLRRSWVLR